MINSLQFGLPESAAYVTDRKQVYFPSVSENGFSGSNGNTYVQLVLTGEDDNYILICPAFVCSSMLLTLPQQQVSIYVHLVKATTPSSLDADATHRATIIRH